MKSKKFLKLINHPMGLVIVLVLLISAADFLTMLLMKNVFVAGIFAEAYSNIIDVILLALIVAPALYFLVFRKLQKDHAQRIQIADELEKSHLHLEEQVLTRTAELMRARDAAESARHAKNAFVANISHEIRIPLNSIIGWNYLLHKEIEEPKQKGQLAKVGEAANHLLRVVNNILELSKIESGKCALEEASFDLVRLIESTVSMVREQAGAKGLLLAVEIDPALPPQLHADPLRLGQILFNFISNAIRYSDKGTVTVRAMVIEDIAQHLLVRIEVEDQGIGLTRAQKEGLFHTFQQMDQATTREFGTSGLGLVISRQLTRLMGGDIGVVSEYGAGSTFWMTAYMGKVQDKGARLEIGRLLLSESSAQIIARKFRGKRLLVAEDDYFNQELMLELLAETGIVVDVAENGRHAVEKVLAGNYDVVLMDIQMPEMDGLAATRLIRQHPAKATLPILALTAHALDEDRKLCMEAGMNEYLSKPVDPDMLYAVLLHWLSKSARSAE